jgi:hypothetical protein
MSLSGEVSYSFTMVDNVTPVSEKMADAQEKLATKVKETTKSLDSQRIANINTLTSLRAFRSGISNANNALRDLGLINDATYQSFRKVSAGITLFTASAEAIKGATALIRMARSATAGLAVASVFARIAENPVLGAAAVIGAGAVGYGFATMMNDSTSAVTNSTVNNTTNINVNGTPSQEQRVVSAGLNTGSYYQ